jgi:hypothetical protein
MIDEFADLVSAVLAHLTPAERASGVAYAAETQAPFAGGARLEFPGAVLEVPAEAYLAFIDREPTANWGHSARYLLVGRVGGQTWSVETRLPPFQPNADFDWLAIYQAPSVPDAAVAVPGRFGV